MGAAWLEPLKPLPFGHRLPSINSRALVLNLDSIAAVAAAVLAVMPPSRSVPTISSSAARWRSVSVPRAVSNSPRNASCPPTANNSARNRLTVFKKS